MDDLFFCPKFMLPARCSVCPPLSKAVKAAGMFCLSVQNLKETATCSVFLSLSKKDI